MNIFDLMSKTENRSINHEINMIKSFLYIQSSVVWTFMVLVELLWHKMSWEPQRNYAFLDASASLQTTMSGCGNLVKLSIANF